MASKHAKDEKANNRKQRRKKGKALRIIMIIVFIIIMIIAGVVAGGYWYVNDKLGKMQKVEINEEELEINEEVEQNLSQYRNIAIFGVDSRANDLGKGNRSDLDETDMKGHEKFESKEEMYATYSKYYNKTIDENTLVKIIKFELIQ